MNAVTLYAWAVPAFFQGSVVDHTWVTTYDSRSTVYSTIADVLAANQHYWYSWGSFHAKGGTPQLSTGFLASGPANLPYAVCLCKPDVSSNVDPAARGTIFNYGRDGVCHQLANQILWSIRRPVVTVHRARGYWLSNAIFGTYGVQHAAWATKKVQCAGAGGRNTMSTRRADLDVDDFQDHLKASLKGRQADNKIKSLMNHRREFMMKLEKLQDAPIGTAMPTAAELNRLYSTFLHDAADILGEDDFRLVFGEPPQDEMNIVDPTFYEAGATRPRDR